MEQQVSATVIGLGHALVRWPGVCLSKLNSSTSVLEKLPSESLPSSQNQPAR